jgi:hypothetical protein
MKFKTFISEAAYNVGHSSSDNADIQKLISYLQGSGNSDQLVMVSTQKQDKYKIKRAFQDDLEDIRKFIKDNGLKVPFATQMFGDGSIGTGGKKVPIEVQEMMTACLVILKYKGGTKVTQEEAVELIEKCKGVYSQVDGSDRRPDFLDFFHGNFKDLSTAISAANYILDEVGTATKVYWTGKGWHKDIVKFNPKLGRIKDYNSSDIVVKSRKKFYGYSLKKKESFKSPDPTLINKPITGKESILQDIVGADITLIENAKRLFFEFVIKKRLGLSAKVQRAMKKAEYSKTINKIPVKEWGDELKKPTNIFFQRTFNIIKSHDKNFVEKFLELVFRTKLDDTLDAEEFQFTLLTGIGKFVRGQIEVEKADGQELSNIVTALQDLYNTNLEVKKTSGKIGAWEKGATAAKVFITIYSDGSPILDIEVRYKGSYSANPQFQAVATADFKAIFKKETKVGVEIK